jgi:hypothetical protein
VEEGSYTIGGGTFFQITGADTTARLFTPCGPQASLFRVRHIARALDGSVRSLRIFFQQVCPGVGGFNGILSYQAPGAMLTVVAPNWIPAYTNRTLTFSVTAFDSMSEAAALWGSGPPGSTFENVSASRGTFTWTPGRLAAGNYEAHFLAGNGVGWFSEAFTTIHVVSTDQAPRAFANGPYTGKAGVPIQFTSAGSNDPEGDPLTYRWGFGDGQSATDPEPRHAYRIAAPYAVTLVVSDGLLLGGDNTLAMVTWPDSASATQVRAVGGPHPIHLEAGDGHYCVALETVDVPSTIVDMDPLTVRMVAKGLGSTDAIPADPASVVLGDANGNGVPDVTMCFGSEALRPLFSRVNGSIHVLTSIEFALMDGRRFHASLPLDVIAPDGTLRPLLAPNPMRPSGTFTFVTTVEGVARLTLFDSHGRRVRSLLDVPMMPTGYHDVPIDTRDQNGRALPSGIYFYRLETKEGIRAGRLTLLR